MQIVIIDHGDGRYSYHGRFTSLYESERFTAWATSNIDSACTAPLGSPLLDMLNADTYTKSRKETTP